MTGGKPGNGAKPLIYAVSDATGEMAMSIAVAALRQFTQPGIMVLRRGKVTNQDRIAKVVREAKETGGLIVFTLVSQELRQMLLQAASESNLTAVDVMGPILEQFTQYFHATPSDQPGLKYQLTAEYFRRNEAVEFTVKHDDGLGLESIQQADIVLLGISRTSKTPLSIYLAYRGFKVANIPLVRGVTLPQEARLLDPRKIVGLTISGEKLSELRETRLQKIGRPISDDYANLESIRLELQYAQKIFSEIGNVAIIDVTTKAIEEVASEILTVLGK